MGFRNKKDLARLFEGMKEMESSAQRFYLEVFSDERIKDEGIKRLFKGIADDEERHAEMVQKILDIIESKL